MRLIYPSLLMLTTSILVQIGSPVWIIVLLATLSTGWWIFAQTNKKAVFIVLLPVITMLCAHFFSMPKVTNLPPFLHLTLSVSIWTTIFSLVLGGIWSSALAPKHAIKQR